MGTFFVFLTLIALLLLTVSCGTNQIYPQTGNNSTELSEVSVLPASAQNSSMEAVITESVTKSQSNESEESMLIQDTLNIVALGDSIPRGYGLAEPEKDSFPTQVADHFKTLYSDVNLKNYAVDGMTSSSLVELLENGEAPEVKNADIIIICVGANNVLPCAYELIYNNNADVTALFNNYGSFLLSDKKDKTALNALSNYFTSIDEYAASRAFNDKINNGIAQLYHDIPRIVGKIKSINPDAGIYFTTIYNPYKGMNVSLPFVETPFRISDLSDTFICRLNDRIIASATENGYKVVDIYTAFKHSNSDSVNAGIDILNLRIEFDPHPNRTGHTLIAQEFISALTEELT